MTNTTSPVKVTPAFYLAVLTLVALAFTVTTFLMDQGFACILGMLVTITGFLVTADVASRYRS